MGTPTSPGHAFPPKVFSVAETWECPHEDRSHCHVFPVNATVGRTARRVSLPPASQGHILGSGSAFSSAEPRPWPDLKRLVLTPGSAGSPSWATSGVQVWRPRGKERSWGSVPPRTEPAGHPVLGRVPEMPSTCLALLKAAGQLPAPRPPLACSAGWACRPFPLQAHGRQR